MFGVVDTKIDLGKDDTPGVIVFNAPEGTRTRTVAELKARLKAANGSLVANANDSDFIVATNNGLRFSLTPLGNGQFRITESSAYAFVIAGVIGVGALIFLNR